ncbi:hypothetical protein DENIS_3453 [Desulfonema ishimotonii]|uniref:Uncharacterized protein n=1 Tax=Desulfonema ishimotonii TaxID=45657 RepID=A0A401FZT3_9BACT|nr:hypothetical protein [Desulfonema ishimotonii]GBC62481.1 hypothetical protein DENIS_3453 [Desulfonema ishimotonii]
MSLKYAHPDVLRGGLDVVRDNATHCVICSDRAITSEQALTDYYLGKIAVSSVDFTWETVSGIGEKFLVGAKSGLVVDITGYWQYLSFVDATRCLLTTVATKYQVYAGNTINLPSYYFMAANPA